MGVCNIWGLWWWREELRNLSQQQGSRWKDLDTCVKHSKNRSKKRLEHLSSTASGGGYHRSCNLACVTATISCFPADYWDVTFMFTIPQCYRGLSSFKGRDFSVWLAMTGGVCVSLRFFFFLNRGEGVNGEIWKWEIIIIKRTLGVNWRQIILTSHLLIN